MMGLDCSHNAWRGAYSAFMTWRREVAHLAGVPPLDLMEGFYTPISNDGFARPATLFTSDREDNFNLKLIDERLPIKWSSLKPSALHELLYHSDCDGEIATENCAEIADELEKIIPLMTLCDNDGHIGNWKDKTSAFVDGLRAAADANEPLDFH